MNKMYKVVSDLQGGDFGMGRIYTIEQWRLQAIEWADMDEHDGIVEELKNLPLDEVIDYIAEFWQLEFEEVDVYNHNYDYDEIKIAVVIAETFRIWNIICDYEHIALLTIMIKEKWKEWQPHGWLTEEEFAYVQKFAEHYLETYKNKIMEELE